MRILTVIPARGGSKGISNKNLQLVGGISLVERAYKCASISKYASDIYVSTEDLEILEHSRSFGYKYD